MGCFGISIGFSFGYEKFPWKRGSCIFFSIFARVAANFVEFKYSSKLFWGFIPYRAKIGISELVWKQPLCAHLVSLVTSVLVEDDSVCCVHVAAQAIKSSLFYVQWTLIVIVVQ